MVHNILSDKTGVGTLFVSTDTSRVLLGLRAPYKTHALQWALFGGMMEDNENPKDALLRELTEELGFVPDIEKIYPFDVYHSKDGHFKYYSFVSVVKEEFIPVLNRESAGYSWLDLGVWPSPLHQGAKISFTSNKSINKLKTIISQHQDTED